MHRINTAKRISYQISDAGALAREATLLKNAVLPTFKVIIGVLPIIKKNPTQDT